MNKLEVLREKHLKALERIKKEKIETEYDNFRTILKEVYKFLTMENPDTSNTKFHVDLTNVLYDNTMCSYTLGVNGDEEEFGQLVKDTIPLKVIDNKTYSYFIPLVNQLAIDLGVKTVTINRVDCDIVMIDIGIDFGF
ncbi:MAG: hypothetical protein ACRC5M_04815 [Anaeroplasmataceae bacterium]